MSRAPVLFCDDGEERELPFKWTICGGCDGHGRSSAYLGAFTGDQMREDPDFAEDYFAGNYDRCCDECGGGGKVKVADLSKMSKADRKRYREQEREIEDTHAIERQERLMEGGWREEGVALMGIVNPRPAMRGRERRAIENRLRLHAEFTQRLEAEGMSREEASRKAFIMVTGGGEWIEPDARTALAKTAGPRP